MMDLGYVNSPATAFTAGLITSLHCVGMCGPLACSIMPVRAATPGVASADPQLVATTYHVSRMAGYAVVGAIGGAIGMMPLAWMSQPVMRWIPWLLVLFFVAMAFRWDRFLPKIPGVGRLMLTVQGWTRGRSRVSSAAALGLATPLLPCGPLYFILTIALLSGSALRGVEFMLAFGLGTVPLLWLAQTQFDWVRRKISPLWLNRLRITLGLVAALAVAWRLRATLGLPGPDPSNFLCH